MCGQARFLTCSEYVLLAFGQSGLAKGPAGSWPEGRRAEQLASCDFFFFFFCRTTRGITRLPTNPSLSRRPGHPIRPHCVTRRVPIWKLGILKTTLPSFQGCRSQGRGGEQALLEAAMQIRELCSPGRSEQRGL